MVVNWIFAHFPASIAIFVFLVIVLIILLVANGRRKAKRINEALDRELAEDRARDAAKETVAPFDGVYGEDDDSNSRKRPVWDNDK